MTLFWVGLIAGRLLVMTLTRRFSPARLLLFLSSTLAVFAVAVALAPSQAVSLVLAVGAGLGGVGLVHRRLEASLPAACHHRGA